MITPPPHGLPLRSIPPDYVCESIAMLHNLPPDVVASYLVVIAIELQSLGLLTPFRLARINHLVRKYAQEVDKAA